MKSLLLGVAGFFPLVFAKDVIAQWRGYGGWGMDPGMMDWGYGMGWVGMILMASIYEWITKHGTKGL